MTRSVNWLTAFTGSDPLSKHRAKTGFGPHSLLSTKEIETFSGVNWQERESRCFASSSPYVSMVCVY